jgi:cytochrome c oxidase assembly factor CtaG
VGWPCTVFYTSSFCLAEVLYSNDIERKKDQSMWQFCHLLLYVAGVSTLFQSTGHGCTVTGHGNLLTKDM